MPQVSASQQPMDEEQDEPALTTQRQTNAVDALLEEIDGTLQLNAEQFVRSFVQKGGQ